MVFKFIHDGKKFEVDLNPEQFKELISNGIVNCSLTVKKHTGYERVANKQEYYSANGKGDVRTFAETEHPVDDSLYAAGNYYSDQDLAIANERADRLFRQLRRFAAENDEKTSIYYTYFTIVYMWPVDKISAMAHSNGYKDFGEIRFLSKEIAEKAIEQFKDELMWYFTEYKYILEEQMIDDE